MPVPFLKRLESGVVLGDGAMGTQLYERGVFINRNFDELNLTDAYLIKARLPYPPYTGFGDRIEIYISKDENRVPLFGRMEMALGYLEIKLRPE